MPDYDVELNDGRKFTVTANRQPTPEELEPELNKFLSQPQEPTTKQKIGKAGSMIARVGIPIAAGLLLAPETFGGSLLVGGASALAAAGVGQGIEKATDNRKDFSLKEAGIEGAVGAATFGLGSKIPGAMQVGKTILGTGAKQAVVGAGLGVAGQQVATGLNEGRWLTPDEVKQSAVIGGATGGIVGSALHALMPKPVPPMPDPPITAKPVSSPEPRSPLLLGKGAIPLERSSIAVPRDEIDRFFMTRDKPPVEPDKPDLTRTPLQLTAPRRFYATEGGSVVDVENLPGGAWGVPEKTATPSATPTAESATATAEAPKTEVVAPKAEPTPAKVEPKPVDAPLKDIPAGPGAMTGKAEVPAPGDIEAHLERIKALDEIVNAEGRAKNPTGRDETPSLSDTGKWLKGKAETIRSLMGLKAKQVRDYVQSSDVVNDPLPHQQRIEQWDGSLQMKQLAAKNWQARLTQMFPETDRAEAFSHWLAAQEHGGDEFIRDAVKQHLAAGNTDLAESWAKALTLTPGEKAFGNKWLEQAAQLRAEAQAADVLGEAGREKYFPRYVVKGEDGPMAPIDAGMGKFPTGTMHAKAATFDTPLAGELQGVRYLWDSRDVLPGYMDNMGGAIANRDLRDILGHSAASDGRTIWFPGGEKSDPEAYWKFQKNKDTYKDYQKINSGPFEGYAHPDAYKTLTNLFEQKGWDGLGKVVQFQRAMKEVLFGWSAFHQVHLGVHAAGHGVMPWELAALPNLDELIGNEAVRKGMDHGLQLVSDEKLRRAMYEGMGGANVLGRVPGIGKYGEQYTNWLFGDWIPRLKGYAFTKMLQRNAEWYPDLTEAQTLRLTSKQVNASFGEQSVRTIARDPRLQQMMSLMLVSPDFTESRLKFLTQAIQDHGAEQRRALALIGGGLYVTARLLNYAASGDMQTDPKHAFSVILGNREYGIRSIPGDMINAMTDPQRFAFRRVGQIPRASIELLTKQDYRGLPVDFLQQLKDIGSSTIPIWANKRDDVDYAEQLGDALGIHVSRYSAESDLRHKAIEWQKTLPGANQDNVAYPQSKYARVKRMLDDGNMDAAKTEMKKLVEDEGAQKAVQGLGQSIMFPLAGSWQKDALFKQTLSPADQEKYNEVLKRKVETSQKIGELLK